MAKEYTELQLRAKEAGIKGWHIKLAKTLESELGEEVTEAIEEVVDEVPEVADLDPMKLLRLLKGRTWDMEMMGIKGRAQKSDLWEYRDIIKKEYERELKEAKALANGNK